MAFSLRSHLLPALLAAGAILAAQDQKAALQQHLAALKESLAKNQQSLKQYSWTETTLLSLKGEEKNRSQKEVHYGPDGQLVKTPLGPAPESGGKRRGLKGKIVDKKVGELKDYMDRAGSLIHRYFPPDPAKMKASFDSGKAALSRNAGASSTTIVFTDYEKPGDSLSLTFSQGQVKSVAVKSYLDDAADAVTLTAGFQPLADGTNYMAESVLNVAAKQIEVRVTNFDHKKVAGQ